MRHSSSSFRDASRAPSIASPAGPAAAAPTTRSPWARASTLPTAFRSLLFALSASSAAALSAYFALGFPAGRYRRVHAIVLGASGPLAALGTLRAFERADARVLWFVLVPLAAALTASAVGWALARLLRERSAARK